MLPWEKSPCGRAARWLSSSPLHGTAAGPFMGMLMEDLPWLSPHMPTPEKNHLSLGCYSQAGLEVTMSSSLICLIIASFSHCPSLSCLEITQTFPPLHLIPFHSFYYLPDSRWQGSLSQAETYRNVLQEICFHWGGKIQLSRQKSVRRQFPLRVSVALWVNTGVLKPFHNCNTS